MHGNFFSLKSKQALSRICCTLLELHHFQHHLRALSRPFSILLVCTNLTAEPSTVSASIHDTSYSSSIHITSLSSSPPSSTRLILNIVLLRAPAHKPRGSGGNPRKYPTHPAPSACLIVQVLLMLDTLP